MELLKPNSDKKMKMEKTTKCKYCNYQDHPKVIEYHIKKCGHNPKNIPKNLEGIGGWLLIPTIGLILGFLISLQTSFTSLLYVLQEPDTILFFIFNISITILIAYTLFLLFKHKKSTPKWFIITIWFQAIVGLWMSWVFGDYTAVIPGIVSNIIWTLYFNASRRVKITFVK